MVDMMSSVDIAFSLFICDRHNKVWCLRVVWNVVAAASVIKQLDSLNNPKCHH